MFECSSISSFNFKNGIVKKLDRHMECQKDQVIIGCDFFKKLCEENTKDLCLPPTLFDATDELLTHTKIAQSIKPSSGMETNNNEAITQLIKPSSGTETNNNDVGSSNDSEATLTVYNSDSEEINSSDDSSNNYASDEEIDDLEMQKLKDKISCPKRGRFVSSECRLKIHQRHNACEEANFNNEVEARAIRTLRKNIDYDSM